MNGQVKIKNLTKLLILVTILVINLGGVIRIYDAGESCPDWPKCFGSLGFDISENEQEEWYNDNPDEIDSRGKWHRYTTFEIFTEWIHRFLAGFILGPLVILNWGLARWKNNYKKEIRISTTISFALIIWQGAIGMLTVKMDNEHWSVILHLGSALVFMLSLIWTWMILAKEDRTDWFTFSTKVSNLWRNKILFMSSLTLLTLFSGTLVSTSPGANNGCGVNGFYQSWPLCNNELISSISNIVEQSQMIHRWLVALVGIILIRYSYLILQQNDEDSLILKKWVLISTGIYLLNILLGGLYIISWTPDGYFIEVLSLIHLLLASSSFLLIATAYIGFLIPRLNVKNDIIIPED